MPAVSVLQKHTIPLMSVILIIYYSTLYQASQKVFTKCLSFP
jgi:hypothetical protein